MVRGNPKKSSSRANETRDGGSGVDDATSRRRRQSAPTRRLRIARAFTPRTFLCALRYCVVHASFAGLRRRLNSRLHFALRNRYVCESIFVRRIPCPG
jgi:hypothetical protein